MHETMNNNPDFEHISLSSRVRYRTVAEDGVLVHLESGRVIVVNEVGLYIVQLLDAPMTQEDLLASVTAEFDVSNEQAKTDIDFYLAELDKEQLLQHHA